MAYNSDHTSLKTKLDHHVLGILVSFQLSQILWTIITESNCGKY